MNTLVIGLIVVGVVIGLMVLLRRKTPASTKCPRTFDRTDSPVCPSGFSIQADCTCSPCDEKIKA
jgi:hypothetical protein